jgi:hypothetical protein
MREGRAARADTRSKLRSGAQRESLLVLIANVMTILVRLCPPTSTPTPTPTPIITHTHHHPRPALTSPITPLAHRPPRPSPPSDMRYLSQTEFSSISGSGINVLGSTGSKKSFMYKPGSAKGELRSGSGSGLGEGEDLGDITHHPSHDAPHDAPPTTYNSLPPSYGRVSPDVD